jgi:hypothetical protein
MNIAPALTVSTNFKIGIKLECTQTPQYSKIPNFSRYVQVKFDYEKVNWTNREKNIIVSAFNLYFVENEKFRNILKTKSSEFYDVIVGYPTHKSPNYTRPHISFMITTTFGNLKFHGSWDLSSPYPKFHNMTASLEI